MLAGLSLSFTQRETNKTCHVDLRDFSKFLLGGGWKGVGGAEPALWANGKEVGEAWVSPVGESAHQGGHP